MRTGAVAAVGTRKGESPAMPSSWRWVASPPVFLRTVGIRVPIYPVKGITITVDAAPWNGAPQCAVIDDGRLFGLVPIGDRMRVSGSAEIAGYDTTPSRERCQAIIDNVISVFPSFSKCYDPAKAFFWAGLRPVASSGVPYWARRRSQPHVNAGHGHCGWTMGCGSGRVSPASSRRKKPDIDARASRPRRISNALTDSEMSLVQVIWR